MPVLEKQPLPVEDSTASNLISRERAPAIFPVCAYRGCTKGWMQLWRNRRAPVLEGAWACSPKCMQAMVEACVRRELDGRGAVPAEHRHRVPIGLILMEQGWISHQQLKNALQAQKKNGSGRIGHWLMVQEGLEEQLLTRALSLQWNCPVFSLDHHRPEEVVAQVPRLFVDTFGVLPLRVARSSLLYIGFEDRIDRSLIFGIERMTGLVVEAGLVAGSEFWQAHPRMLEAQFPKSQVLEIANVRNLAFALTSILERVKPVDAKLIRICDFFWLRMWRTTNVFEDVLCLLKQD